MKFSPTKKLLTALLVCAILLSTACNVADPESALPTSADSTIESAQDEAPTEEIIIPTTEEAPPVQEDPEANEPVACGGYYAIYRLDDAEKLYRYIIYDQDRKVIKEETGFKHLDIDIVEETILKIEAKKPGGEITYLFYHIFEDKFSEEYRVDLEDVSKEMMAYKITNNGKSSLVVHDIFDSTKNYREFELDANATDCQAELLYRDNVLKIDLYQYQKPWKTEYYPFSHTVVDFASYESILATYHKIIEIRPNPYQFLWDFSLLSEPVLPLFTFVSEDAKKEFSNLAYLANEYHPDRSGSGYEWYTTEATATFGYTYRDLNGDSSDELILLTEDYKLLALYTMKDGKPMRVEDIWGRRLSCTIDAQNRLHIFSSFGAANSTEKVCVLSADGKLETLAEYGINGVDENNDLIRIKVVEDQFVTITKEEYDALDKLYGIDLPEGMLAAEYMRLTVGLGFTPLEPITRLQARDIISWIYSRRSLLDFNNYNFLDVCNIRADSARIWIGNSKITATVDKNLIFFAEEGFVGHLEIFGSCAWITIEECENALYPAGTYLLKYFTPAKG